MPRTRPSSSPGSPEVAGPLRRVLEIHQLVGSASTATASCFPTRRRGSAGFPEAGQMIAGFHLVEELGRGAFARVFLARERQLADRPVALKVSRRGLARAADPGPAPAYAYCSGPLPPDRSGDGTPSALHALLRPDHAGPGPAGLPGTG